MGEWIAIGVMGAATAVLCWLLAEMHRRAKTAERDLRWAAENYEIEKMISSDYRRRYRLAEQEVARLAGVVSQCDKERSAIVKSLDAAKSELEHARRRDFDQARLVSDHEDAFDQIFAIAQKHARPF